MPAALADIVLSLATHRGAMTPIAHAELSAVRAWMQRVAARPAYSRYCSPAAT